MIRKLAGSIAAMALVLPGVLHAHHSQNVIQTSESIWVKGTVVRYETMEPHAMLVLKGAGPDGQVHEWLMEGPSLMRFKGLGVEPDIMHEGDAIEFCGFALKPGVREPYESPFRVAERTYIHGQVVVLANGAMQAWGPYGNMRTCTRANDDAQTWLDFLNAQPAARTAWCDAARLSSGETSASSGLVDEVSGRMNRPCSRGGEL